MKTHSSSEGPLRLFSRRADFWLACGGASVGLLAAVLVILWHGDRELDGLDFVLSEFHLGATYGAIIQRRLWRQRQVDVVLVPLIILAVTYALSMSGQGILLTSRLEHRMHRFCWSSPCIMRCNIFISPTPWPGAKETSTQ